MKINKIIAMIFAALIFISCASFCIIPYEAEEIELQEVFNAPRVQNYDVFANGIKLYNSLNYDELDSEIFEIRCSIGEIEPEKDADILDQDSCDPTECTASESLIEEDSNVPDEPIQENEKTSYTASESLTEQSDVFYIANVMAGECYIFEWDDMIKVGMTICNRVDDPQFDNTFYEVVSHPYQMNYDPNRYIDQEYWDAAEVVYQNWLALKNGEDIFWEYYLYWHAGGGTTNVFEY